MSESQDYSDLSIRRLELHQVGPFKDLVLEFPCKREEDRDRAEVHIFVGENGTGKTTLLEAMTYFHCWSGENGQWKKLSDKIKLWESESFLSIGFSGETMIFKRDGQRNKKLENFFIDYFRSSNNNNPKYRSYCFFAYDGSRRLNQNVPNSPTENRFDPIREALSFDKIEGQTNIFNWIKDNKTRAALAFQAGKKADSAKFLLQIEKIEAAVGEILDRKIRFVIDQLSLVVQLQLEGESITLTHLPDGYQSLISWLADLLFRLDYILEAGKERFTLFLDEIDIHLHPKAQRKILPVIQKLFPNAQIFITTHSPFVVGSVDGAWVYKFKLDAEGYSVLDGEPRLSEDADSYRTILEEVFDIHEQFGIEAQAKLDKFYKLRQEVLNGPTDSNWREFNQLGQELASQSDEMHNFVSLELRQAARILNRKLIA